jgi:hypothetical protein
MPHHPFDWKPIFLAALAEVPVVSHACKVVDISYRHAYKAREADEEFAKAWDEAIEQGVDRAEQEAFRRAVVGFEEPVIDKGRLAYRYERYEDEDGKEQYRLQLDANGQPIPLTVRKHSDALLALYLKGRRKAVYAERKELTGADGAALPASQIVIATGVPSDTFDDLA